MVSTMCQHLTTECSLKHETSIGQRTERVLWLSHRPLCTQSLCTSLVSLMNQERSTQPKIRSYQSGTTPRSSFPYPRKGKERSSSNKTAGQDKGKQKEDSSLDLSGTKLLAPPTFSQHAGLRKLNVSNCGLTSLSFVRELRRSLTWLNVSGNNLRDPDSWGGVNELSGLFGEFAVSSYRRPVLELEMTRNDTVRLRAVLNASECQLTQVPSVVEVLHSLKALVMTHNSLKKLDHVKNLRDLNTIGELVMFCFSRPRLI